MPREEEMAGILTLKWSIMTKTRSMVGLIVFKRKTRAREVAILLEA